MSFSWYYVEDNERVGPVSDEDFITLIKKNKINLGTYVWKKGFENWTLLKEVEDYRDFASLQGIEESFEAGESKLESLGSEDNFEIKDTVGTETFESEENNFSSSVSENSIEQNDFTKNNQEANYLHEVSQEKTITTEFQFGDQDDLDWENIDSSNRIFTIRIGKDRGGQVTEYGPFSADMIRDLKSQKRINFLTEIFAPGMKDYRELGQIPYFGGVADNHEDSKNQRKHNRAPLVARIFFHDSANFFEGVCRDISIGGMQVLVANFKGEVGDVVKLNVHPKDKSLHFTAEAKVVRRLTECSGMSVRFIKMTPDNLDKINKYIELYED